MNSRIQPSRLVKAFQRVLRTPHLLTPEDTAVLFYDLGEIRKRALRLQAAFPTETLHTAAVKACPLPTLLRFLGRLGFGAEAASLPEIHICLAARIPPSKIFFDSPAKTPQELAFALGRGITVNADSLEEVERIAEIIGQRSPLASIGIRINPQVGSGRIRMTSVAGRESKFGVPLMEAEGELLACFQKYSWLTGLHVHIGSQGCPLELLVEGTARVAEFAGKINRILGPRRVRRVDIGGGLPVQYREGEESVTPQEYAKALRLSAAVLFRPGMQVATEFGRYLFANAGWAASRIEYVKKGRGGVTLITHLGADFLLRRCYNPKDWYHDLFLTNTRGYPATGKLQRTTVAGPLCFAGDVLVRHVLLPEVVPGSYVLVRDTGAYTLSMWSRYNSRQIPKVVGYEGNKFRILRGRETVPEVVGFWG